MAQPYVGEIRMVGFNFAPVGWLMCDGSLQAISENETLFNLIGTTYGGDGQSTFGMPDLRGRIPVHMSPSPIGEMAGTESVTLTVQQIPAHSHSVMASQAVGTLNGPQSNVLAKPATINLYSGFSPTGTMSARACGPTGGSQPHDNMQPTLCITFIISLFGIFPSQT